MTNRNNEFDDSALVHAYASKMGKKWIFGAANGEECSMEMKKKNVEQRGRRKITK